MTLATIVPNSRLTRSSIFRDQTKQKSYAARAKSKFHAAVTDNELVVSQTHDLLTLEKIAEGPAVKLTGLGKWHFDLRRKVIRRVAMNYKLSDRRPTQLAEKTISVSIREINPVEAKRRRLETERLRREPIAVEKSDALVEQLLSGNRSKQISALLALRFANPNSQRDAIVALLTPLLKESNKTVRRAAHHAMARWAGKSDVKILAKLLDEDETVLRWAVIDRLAVFRSPLAVKALAGQLSNKHVRGKATDALIKIGSLSEPEMIKLLAVKDTDIVLAALKILAKTGSPKSLPALTKIIDKGGNPVVRLKAVSARAAIQKRAR